MSRKKNKAAIYMEERDKGLTYREIAEKHGVSYQSVHALCMREGAASARKISYRGCIYPNLRNWLSEDKARQVRFFEAMKGCTMRDYLKGILQPKKDVIDRMIRFAGMSYEEMFAEEEV